MIHLTLVEIFITNVCRQPNGVLMGSPISGYLVELKLRPSETQVMGNFEIKPSQFGLDMWMNFL